MIRRWERSQTLGVRAARHVARFQRVQLRRLLNALTRSTRRPLWREPVIARLQALEPIAARTLGDAQLHGYLQGAIGVAALMPQSDRQRWKARAVGSGTTGTGLTSTPRAELYRGGYDDSGSGGAGGGGNGPSGPADDGGEPQKPALHFPQVEAGHRFLSELTPLLPADFENASAQARQVSFTVARAQTLDAVDAIQQAIAEDIRHGGTLKQFRTVVSDAVGDALNDSQAEAIYRTYVGRGYSAGQIAVLDDPAVRSSVPYLEYTAIHDGRTRKEHRAMEECGLDGTAIYRADDPIWNYFYPPWAWNCRCLIIPMDVYEAAERGVTEAKDWLLRGRPPLNPQWVPMPAWRPPNGWVPSGRALSLAA